MVLPGQASTNPQANVGQYLNQDSTSKNFLTQNAGLQVNPNIANQSTTTLSSDKSADIGSIGAITELLSKKGLSTDTQTGVSTLGDGTPYAPTPTITGSVVNADGSTTETYSDGSQKTKQNQSGSVSRGGYVGETYYAPGAQLPKDESGNYAVTSDTSPIDDKIIAGIEDQIQSNDSMTAGLIAQTREQYKRLVRQMEQANTAAESGLTNFLLRSGAIQSTQSGQSVIAGQVSAGIQRIADLNSQEQMDILKAQQAGLEKKYQLQDKINERILTTRKEKQEAAIRLNESMIQASKDQRDFEYKLNQDKIENDFKERAMSADEKQQEIDNAFRLQQISMDQKKFLEQQVQDAKTYELAVSKFNYDVKADERDFNYQKSKDASARALAAQKAQQEAGGSQAAYEIAAQEYASTGKMPTWVTKEDAAKIAIISKTVPQPPGRLVDAITGMPRAGLSATREAAIVALNDSIKTLEIMEKSFGEFHQGLFGKFGDVLPSEARTLYDTMKAEFLSKLLVARSGAAVTEQEYNRLAKLIPGDWNKTLGLGASGAEKLKNMKTSVESNLATALATDGLKITDTKGVAQSVETRLDTFMNQSEANAALVEKMRRENPGITLEELGQILPL